MMSDEEEADEYEVEKIIDMRDRKGKREYLVRWKNFGAEYDEWLAADDMNCDILIEQFLDRRNKEAMKKAASSRAKSPAAGSSKKTPSVSPKKTSREASVQKSPTKAAPAPKLPPVSYSLKGPAPVPVQAIRLRPPPLPSHAAKHSVKNAKSSKEQPATSHQSRDSSREHESRKAPSTPTKNGGARTSGMSPQKQVGGASRSAAAPPQEDQQSTRGINMNATKQLGKGLGRGADNATPAAEARVPPFVLSLPASSRSGDPSSSEAVHKKKKKSKKNKNPFQMCDTEALRGTDAPALPTLAKNLTSVAPQPTAPAQATTSSVLMVDQLKKKKAMPVFGKVVFPSGPPRAGTETQREEAVRDEGTPSKEIQTSQEVPMEMEPREATDDVAGNVGDEKTPGKEVPSSQEVPMEMESGGVVDEVAGVVGEEVEKTPGKEVPSSQEVSMEMESGGVVDEVAGHVGEESTPNKEIPVSKQDRMEMESGGVVDEVAGDVGEENTTEPTGECDETAVVQVALEDMVLNSQKASNVVAAVGAELSSADHLAEGVQENVPDETVPVVEEPLPSQGSSHMEVQEEQPVEPSVDVQEKENSAKETVSPDKAAVVPDKAVGEKPVDQVVADEAPTEANALPAAFPAGLEPESIFDILEHGGKRFACVQFRHSRELHFIEERLVKRRYPRLLIQYYAKASKKGKAPARVN